MAGVIGKGMVIPKTRLGQVIRERRLELGFLQSEIAGRVGSNQAWIQRLESGVIQGNRTSRKTLVNLAGALEIDYSELENLVIRAKRTELGLFVENRCEVLGINFTVLSQRLGIQKTYLTYILNRRGYISSRVRIWAQALEVKASELEQFQILRGKALTFPSPVGEALRSRRRILSMSQIDLAKLVGVTKQTISYIENGTISLSTSPKLLEKMARALQVEFSELAKLIPLPKKWPVNKQ